MSWDYTLTEEEFQERHDLHELECDEGQCGHYDELNRCCWVSWKNHAPGNFCSYGLYQDENSMIVKVLRRRSGCPPAFTYYCGLEDGTACPYYHEGQCTQPQEEEAQR